MGSGAKAYMRKAYQSSYMRKCTNTVFSPYMRRSLVIYDFALDPSKFPNHIRKFKFFFNFCIRIRQSRVQHVNKTNRFQNSVCLLSYLVWLQYFNDDICIRTTCTHHHITNLKNALSKITTIFTHHFHTFSDHTNIFRWRYRNQADQNIHTLPVLYNPNFDNGIPFSFLLLFIL
jgi:hypothetical protein